MKPALLLVDLQADFLRRPGLCPPADEVLENAARLLQGCRALGVPVLHAQTLVQEDGSDCMQHWRTHQSIPCVAGSEGSLAPTSLAPLPHEALFSKRFYSAFEDPRLKETLDKIKPDTLIVCGLYLHACVRATILDAYRHGYAVWVAADAVASPEPAHAEATRAFLEQRAARFAVTVQILAELGTPLPPPEVEHSVPLGWLAGKWVSGSTHRYFEHRNPSNQAQVIAHVPIASSEDIDIATQHVTRAQQGWRIAPVQARLDLLAAWAAGLAAKESELAQSLATEIGKPISEALAEIRRAIAHINITQHLLEHDHTERLGSASVRLCPRGVIALITPWNNPVSIAVGKLAPALALGNGVLWKPAQQASRSSMLLLQTLLNAGVPSELVAMLFGDASTARHAIIHPQIHAVSLTGSTDTGRQAAALCAQHMKPLQAELGGNNAAIIMGTDDPLNLADKLAYAAFGFSGQRCTATRRFIVDASLVPAFCESFAAAIGRMPVGDPHDPLTQIGPLVSRKRQHCVTQALQEAISAGATLVCDGNVPKNWQQGCWLQPALLLQNNPASNIVQQESFGPIAVIQPAKDMQEALRLCNGVSQGLVASLYSDDPAMQGYFLQEAEAGILRINPDSLEIDPAAPFGGWKNSCIGPPEHGRWDREFYTRPQAVYLAGRPKP